MTDKIPTTFLFAETAESVEPADRRVKREERMAAWLEAVGPRGWREACRIAGVEESQVHRWFRLYPEFAAAHKATASETALRLERIADEIAVGDREANPSQVTLLQFRLRGLRPDTYRDRASVQVDATTRTLVEGDGGRARLLLAEWSTPPSHSLPAAMHNPSTGHAHVEDLGVDCGQPGRRGQLPPGPVDAGEGDGE